MPAMCTALAALFALSLSLACRAEDAPPQGALRVLGSHSLRHEGRVTGLAWMPDGKTLVSAGLDGQVRFWDAADGKQSRMLAAMSPIVSLSASSAGGKLAFANKEGALSVVVAETLDEVPLSAAVPRDAHLIAFSPDGTLLAVARGGTSQGLGPEDRVEVMRFDASRAYCLHLQWSVGQVLITSLAWLSDGYTLVAGASNGSVCLWDIAARRFMRNLKGGDSPVLSLTASPAGMLVASAGADGRVFLWDARSGERIAEAHDRSGSANGIAFSPKGDLIATCGADGTIRIQSSKDLSSVRTIEAAAARESSIAFSPDGETLATSCGSQVQLWKAATGERLLGSVGHCAEVRRIAWSADGRRIVSGGEDWSIQVWDVEGSAPPRVLSGPRTDIDSVAISADGRSAACGDADGVLWIWDLSREGSPARVEAHAGAVWGLVFSPDGELLASGGEDMTVRLTRVRDGESVQRLKGHGECVLAASFLPDGKELWSGDMALRTHQWDVATGKGLRLVKGKRGARSLAFSADGRRLAAGGKDGELRVWDLIAKEQLLQQDGNGEAIVCVSLSADGRTLAAVGEKGKTQVIEVASGDKNVMHVELTVGGAPHVSVWDFPNPHALCAAFSPNGRVLATGLRDTTVVLWPVPPGSLGPVPADESVWGDLGVQDASLAYAAIWALVDAPDRAVPLLSSHLRAVAVDADELHKLIAQLDDDDCAKRDAATELLGSHMPAIEPLLRAALDGELSAEARERIRTVLSTSRQGEEASGETLQTIRGIQALEGIGSPAAVEVLERLAAGEASARETREAQAALERVKRRR